MPSTVLDTELPPSAAAAPTTGTWARGDIVWNSEPIPGGNIGWVCTSAGTPGDWYEFGVIEAAP